MNSTSASGAKVERPFSPTLFFVTIGITLAIFFSALAFFFPLVWKRQFESSWKIFLLVFVVAHAFNSLAEYFFHRYVLHAYPFRFLKRFYNQHGLHHRLTHVRLIPKPSYSASACGESACPEHVERVEPVDKSAQRVVSSRYPIVEERQFEASYFPWFSLGAFILISLPILVPFQLWFPESPLLLGGSLAITWSLILYEFVHAFEHLSFEGFWKPKIAHARWGRFWTTLYTFHVRHHASVKCNEAVGGFFGFPIPDFLFRTYISSRLVLSDGAHADESHVLPTHPPIRFIRILDRLSDARMQKHKTAPQT